ncbi:MAG: hypothetical protein IH977_14585 [Nitrospinae bacterium]|nr:hypothetical protein [Nitrospinota bacterium]MEC4672399.1 hypothetical protein [Nitrospirota bacterium]
MTRVKVITCSLSMLILFGEVVSAATVILGYICSRRRRDSDRHIWV